MHSSVGGLGLKTAVYCYSGADLQSWAYFLVPTSHRLPAPSLGQIVALEECCTFQRRAVNTNSHLQTKTFHQRGRFTAQWRLPSTADNSSLINDLAIRTLLETCQDNKCKPIVISALQHMFITATQQNKRVLVDAVLLSIVGHNAGHTNILDVWEHSIVASIGKSSMRMEVVESSLLEKVFWYHSFSFTAASE